MQLEMEAEVRIGQEFRRQERFPPDFPELHKRTLPEFVRAVLAPLLTFFAHSGIRCRKPREDGLEHCKGSFFLRPRKRLGMVLCQEGTEFLDNLGRIALCLIIDESDPPLELVFQAALRGEFELTTAR